MKSGLRAAFGWGSAQAATRMVVGFASIKVTAVLLGPAGIALVGQAANFLTLMQGTLGNAIQTAVTKLTAEEQGDASTHLPLWGTAMRLAIGLAIVAGILVAAFNRPLARWLFDREDLGYVVIATGLVLPFTLLTQALSGILTGLRSFRLVALFNMSTTLLGALIFIGLSYAFGLPGGLIGTIVAVASGALVIVAVIRRAKALPIRAGFRHWEAALVPSIVAFYPMLLVHSAAEPLTLILVRDAIIGTAGVEQAGLWQAVLRLSNMYTMVLITTLSMYSLPTLSAIKDPGEFRSVMFGMAAKMGAATAAAALLIYLCRDLIVHVVFSAKFGAVRDLIGVQLVGDVLNVASWPLHSALMAQNRSKTYMALEVAIAVVQVGLAKAMVSTQGAGAGPAAYAATSGLALLGLVAMHWRLRSRNLAN